MMPTHLCLHISGASNLPRTWSSKPPNAFIEIQISGSSKRTRTIPRSTNPLWNEEFQLTALEPSSILHLRAVHESRWSKTYLCGLNISISKLPENLNHDIKLCLEDSRSEDHSESQSQLTLRIISQKRMEAGAVAISEARQALKAKGLSSSTRDKNYTGPGALQSLAIIVSKLDTFVQIADETARIHPYSYLVWQVTSSVYKIIRGQLDRDSAIVDLLCTMEQTYAFVDVIEMIPEKIPLLNDTIQNILTQTFECALYIQEYTENGFYGRIQRQFLSDADDTIKQFRLKFVELKASFDSGVAINTALVSFRDHQNLDNLVRMQTLRKLRPVAMDSPGHTECLPNTRLDILEHITKWITNPHNEQNVLWLHGLAGSGKSTIATSIANLFRDINRLGAFVFFSRDVKKRSDPASVIRTLAYQLGSFDPRLGSAIAASIDVTPSVTQAPIAFQFSKLIIGPLASQAALHSEGPVVLVLDALDECGNARARRELISVLANESAKLPAFVRLIVTSRAELDLRNEFEMKGNICGLGLETTSDLTDNDIMTYIRHHMTRIRADNKILQLPSNWPGSHKMRALCDRACGLFVWASTAIVFIEDGHDPEERVDILLQVEVASDAESALDILYTKALQSAGLTDPTFISDFHAILGTIISVREPLTHSAIDHLLGLDKRRPSLHTLLRLGCVLECSAEKPVRVLHPSFADFLSSPRRCKNEAWLIDPPSHNFTLANLCFDRLEEVLQRNLCNLTLSSTMVECTIPEYVSYACIFWVDHVCMINEELTPIGHRVEKFLFNHLLHWLEAMSILKRSWTSAELLARVAEWARISLPQRQSLLQLLNDAIMCTQSYPNFIECHPLLIYESVLPLLPISSILYQTFHDQSTCPWVAGGFEESCIPPLQKILSGHNEIVRSVSFSPDGLRIVSCSEDRTIRVWNHTSGMESMVPFRGHEDQILSVCFSPDGSRIISGSKDRTVRVWDSHQGEQIQPPLRGHMGNIFSVAISPDGQHIVSGSEDMTIRLWDPAMEAQPCLPLEGHSGWVWSVCFSPDGKRILSGSEDRTVRLWDALTGAPLAVMAGHDGAVMSVAFAPDGVSFASGSVDRTVRLWDLSSDDEETAPWAGTHSDAVLSVSFSPDGTRIASTSDDIIHLWDVESGTESSPPLRAGHTGVIHSVAFSPNGRHIVSGSTDRTVCLWDAAATPDGGQSEEAKKDARLCALACSPDGAVVVSGSQDHTLRVWDAVSGEEQLRGPLMGGHADAVVSVAFSPDGARFVSGAQDMSVCVWDTSTGTKTLGPLFWPGAVDAGRLLVGFSEGGEAVIACLADDPGRVVSWDAMTGVCLSTTTTTTTTARHAVVDNRRGPLEVTPNAWVVEATTGRTISRLPRTIPVVTTTSSQTMIAIGTLSGCLIIMHFPAGRT